jgi:uncharacterized protein YndB with AHSA1/START domain
MTTDNIKSSTGSGEMEIISTRVFAAPREVLYNAFENPDHLKQWWGPKGFTNTFHEFDLRPGGKWRFIMHGPNGAEYNNVKDFTEVIKPERIAFNHDGPMHRFKMTITFEDISGKTKLHWRMVFERSSENQKLRSFIEEANEQNFDRLEAFLKSKK